LKSSRPEINLMMHVAVVLAVVLSGVQFGTATRWTARYRQEMRIVFALAALFVFAGNAFAEDAAHGKQVFTDLKCLVCHSVGGEGNKKGAALDDVGAKLTAEDIRHWVTNAPEMAAKANIDRKPPMKAYTDFSKEQVDALVAYLVTLKNTDPVTPKTPALVTPKKK
jgi:mono/diheme cytochrome c family protein